jgi:hypothetical protein
LEKTEVNKCEKKKRKERRDEGEAIGKQMSDKQVKACIGAGQGKIYTVIIPSIFQIRPLY